MTNSKYAAFVALDPFFDIVMQGLAGAVAGDHYFEAVADDAVAVGSQSKKISRKFRFLEFRIAPRYPDVNAD
jgi:hypothetical protein